MSQGSHNSRHLKASLSFPQVDSSAEWIQVNFRRTMRVTGLMTQGAKSAFTKMFVKEFSLSSSLDGKHWASVLQGGKEKVNKAYTSGVSLVLLYSSQ